MALSQQLVQKQTQKLVMTQDLRQSIELLPLSNLELSERIQNELLENPLIELSEEDNSPSNQENGQEYNKDTEESSGDGHYENYREFQDYRDRPAPDREGMERKHEFLQQGVSSSETLQEHLLRQFRLFDISEEELAAGELLITAIDTHGFLTEDPAKLLAESGFAATLAGPVLEIIQDLDPTGCGANNVQDALLIQARKKYDDDDIVLDLIQNHFQSLEKLDYKKIEKHAGYTLDEIHRSMILIRTLEPYPGTLYTGRTSDYVIPDLSVIDVDSQPKVIINDEWIPMIRIQEDYSTLARKAKDPEEKSYIEAKLHSAEWLVRGIRQRRQTLYRTMAKIVEHQKEFFLKGHGHLVPLTLREIAEDLELHESTVSRITTNKYVQTKWGIFQLKYFFTSSLKKSDGGKGESSRNIKERVLNIIKSEDPESPLSDQEIVRLIEKEGVKIARRTVAKYRKVLNIPSADRRKILKAMEEN